MKKTIRSFFKDIVNRDFLLSITCLMVLQAIIFALIKYLQVDYHTYLSPIDDVIPFVPHFIYVYNLFYPFIFIVLYYVFVNDKENYYHGVIAGTIGYLLSDIIFLLYPTVMIRPDVMYDKLDVITGFLVKITYTIDNPALNCFPSIHCLFCFQAMYTTILCKNITKDKKVIIIFVLFLITISTVLVKQHYFYDILGAFFIFCLSNAITYLLFRITKRK